MKKEIGCKNLPEQTSATAEQVRSFFAEHSELYFTQKELAAEFEKSNPCMNKVLNKLCESKFIARTKVSSRFYYKLC
tara:strand:- start:2622 stop:2852 length:231 start_codon:yes stop_codon:yes gene_type:complete